MSCGNDSEIKKYGSQQRVWKQNYLQIKEISKDK